MLRSRQHSQSYLAEITESEDEDSKLDSDSKDSSKDEDDEQEESQKRGFILKFPYYCVSVLPYLCVILRYSWACQSFFDC